MRKLVLACGILASVVSVSMGAMSGDELERARHNCFENNDKSACQALINNHIENGWGLENCIKDICAVIGGLYYYAGRYREAIPYFEKDIALGDNVVYALMMLGATYDKLQDYRNAKKYFEIGCNKGNGDKVQAMVCCDLGIMYYNGKGVRQDYNKAQELYKKACDLKSGVACNNLGLLYDRGQGVRQNRSTAKQYYGKACDLGEQTGCDNYKLLNSQGVQ